MLEGIPASVAKFAPFLWEGATTTFAVLAGALMIAIVGGLLVALGSLTACTPLRLLCRSFVELVRGTPALAQLFILYFGLAAIGFIMQPLTAAIIGLGINGSAYVAEVFRGGIRAVNSGQREAALSLGLTPMSAMLYVILPQAIRIMLPSFCNYAVQLLKDTSLVSAVAAPEIMFRARVLVSETYDSMTIYLMVAVFYLAISIPLSKLASSLQGRIGAQAR